MKLRAYLSVLVLAGVVPVIILTVMVTLSVVREQRIAAERGLSDTVAALAGGIETEVGASVKSLQTLAASPALDDENLPAFYEEARRVRDVHAWSTVGLIDSAGRHRLNVARPVGASLPDLRDRQYFKEVVATGKPYVSDLILGRAVPTRDIAVAVPVLRHGTLKYVLFAGVDPARFASMFAPPELPAYAVVSLVSRDGVFLARNRDHLGALGQHLPEEYLRQIRSAPQGRAQRVSREGIELETAYRRLPLTGWTVDLGIPADLFSGPMRRIAWLGGTIGMLLVVAAIGLAVAVARRMVGEIDVLTSAASRIGDGVPAPAHRLRVLEFEAMRGFVAQADAMLKERLHRERAARSAAEHVANILRRVQTITETALHEGSAQGIMRALLHSVRTALGSDTASILLLASDGTHLTPVSSDGLREEIAEDVKIPLGYGVAGQIALSERGLIFPDLGTLDVISPFLRDRVKSLMGAPLRVADRLIGVIHVGASTPHVFSDDDLRLLGLVADRVALVIELARLHEAERTARADAEQANQAKDQFLAMLSHELRTPLTSIVGWARLLRLRPDDPPTVSRALDSIESNADLQTRLVDDLLDVSRIVTGTLRLDRRPVDLGGVAEAAVEAVRPAAAAKSMAIDVHLDEAVAVFGDATRLRQVITNLLTNAVKFTPEKGLITVKVGRSGDDAVVAVADTGEGIPGDFLPHVFEAFRQAQSAPTRKAASGLGLGLAIVRHLVELHGGSVTAESAGERRGATFIVRLPLHAAGARR